MGDVIDSTLMHINKEKAYGRQGKAPTGLIFDPNRLLPPPPRTDPPGISIFLALDGKIPWVGTLELSNSLGTKKEGKCPVLRQHCNIFH